MTDERSLRKAEKSMRVQTLYESGRGAGAARHCNSSWAGRGERGGKRGRAHQQNISVGARRQRGAWEGGSASGAVHPLPHQPTSSLCRRWLRLRLTYKRTRRAAAKGVGIGCVHPAVSAVLTPQLGSPTIWAACQWSYPRAKQLGELGHLLPGLPLA